MAASLVHSPTEQHVGKPHLTPPAPCTQCGAGYKLRQRALHVFTEAARVPEFREACNSRASTQDKMAELARLMNDSQTSCRRAAPVAKFVQWPSLYCGINNEMNPSGLLGSRLAGSISVPDPVCCKGSVL